MVQGIFRMRLSTQKKTVGKLILSLISTRKLAVFIFAGLTGFALEATAIRLAQYSEIVGTGTVRVLSLPVAVFVTWHINRTYGFQITRPATAGEFVLYCKFNGLAQVSNILTYMYLCNFSSYFGAHPIVALTLATSCSMIVSFLGYCFVFRSRPR